MKSIMDHLREAHAKTGAPGKVTGFWGNGYYNALGGGYSRKFRFQSHPDGRVTVYPSWQIVGKRQRRQATSTKS